MPGRKRLTAKFSQEWVRHLKTPAERQEWYDTDCRGLTLRVGTSGVKTFYFFARVHGKLTRMKLGVSPDMPVAEARSEVTRIRGDFARGATPKPRAMEARDELTLGDLFQWYMRMHAKPHKRTWRDDERRFQSRLLHWSNRRLSSITSDMVTALHVEIGGMTGRDENGQLRGGHYAANKMLELLGFMWRLGQKKLQITAPDPTKNVMRFAKHDRERYLTTAELPRFLAAVAKLPRETTRDYLLMLLFTGARRSNVAAMMWDQIDMEESVWVVPATRSKNKRALRVILPAAAMEILHRRKATAGESPWVFPGQGRSGHINEPKHALKAACETAGISDLRLHDLRRTLGSWQARQGTSLQIIGKTLGHESLQSTRIYARLADDSVREAVEAATMAMVSPQKKSEK